MSTRRVAFTLVELLVVVAIIALLLAILAPSMVRAKEYTRRAVCRSQTHQLLAAATTYASANKSVLPSGKRNLVGGVRGEHCIWISDELYNLIRDQTGRHDMISCPNLPGFGYQNQYGWVIGYNYLGHHPRMNELKNFRSPIRLAEDPGLPVWTDLNNWCPGYWVFVAHLARGPLGQYPFTNYSLGGIDAAAAGSEGGNVAYLDGSARWKNIGEMKTYESGEWGPNAYPCMW